MIDAVFHLTGPTEYFRAGGLVYITWDSGGRLIRGVQTAADFKRSLNRAVNIACVDGDTAPPDTVTPFRPRPR